MAYSNAAVTTDTGDYIEMSENDTTNQADDGPSITATHLDIVASKTPTAGQPVESLTSFGGPPKPAGVVPKAEVAKESVSSCGLDVLCSRLEDFFLIRWTGAVLDSAWFEAFILCSIAVYCALVAAQQPQVNEPLTVNAFALWTERVVMLIWTVELVAKLVVTTLDRGRTSFFKQALNWMDAIALPSMFTPIDVRTLRALWFLRLPGCINRLSGDRVLSDWSHYLSVCWLGAKRAFQSLHHIGVILGLFWLQFAIIGQEMYKGAFHYYCQPDEESDSPVNALRPCAPSSTWAFGERACRNDSSCVSPPSNSTAYWQGPNNGITSFDNIYLALVTVFQCLTRQRWTQIYYLANDAKGIYFNWIYFLPIILIGSFILIELMATVFAGEYAIEVERHMNKWEFEKLRKQQADQLELNENGDNESEAAETKSSSRLQSAAHWVTGSVGFYAIVHIVIGVNLVAQSVVHYGQPAWLTTITQLLAFGVLIATIVEVALRLVAEGFRQYMQSAWNVFDLTIIIAYAVVGTWDLIAGTNTFVCFTVIRSLRLIDVAQNCLRRFYPQSCLLLDNVAQCLSNSTLPIQSLFYVLFIFATIVALTFKRLFGGKMHYALRQDTQEHHRNLYIENYLSDHQLNEKPHHHFDSFFSAFLSTFQLMTTENWNQIMYDATALHGFLGWALCLMFIGVLCVGTYLLLRLLLFLITDNLATAVEMTACMIEQKKCENEEKSEKTVTESTDYTSFPDSISVDSSKYSQQPPLPEISQPLIGVMESHSVEIAITCVIVVGTWLMATYVPEGWQSSWNYFDYIYTALLGLELAARLSQQRLRFVKDAFNVLDTLLLCLSALAYVMKFSANIDKALRSLKVLRLLRLPTIWPLKATTIGCRLKVNLSLACRCFGAIFNQLLFAFHLLVVLIFATIGKLLFCGKFSFCNDRSVDSRSDCQGTYLHHVAIEEPPLQMEREWTTHTLHFDDLPNALHTVFVITLGESWTRIRELGMHSREVDRAQSAFTQRPWTALYFIGIIISSTWFLLNLVTSLIVIKYSDENESDKDSELDKNQWDCIDAVTALKPDAVQPFEDKVDKPYGAILMVVYQRMKSNYFQNFMTIMVICSTCILFLRWHNQAAEVTRVLNYVDFVLYTIYLTEVLLCCLTTVSLFGIKAYFCNAWHWFLLLTYFGSLADQIYVHKQFELLNIIRVLRLFRPLRLLKAYGRGSTVHNILQTFLQLPQHLLPGSIICGSLFFTYAVVGRALFGFVALHENSILNQHNNFGSFTSSLFLLFRCATGETRFAGGGTGWPDIMAAVSSPAPCDQHGKKVGLTDCGSNFAYAYFISFIVMSSLFMIKILVSVVMNRFDYLTRDRSILGRHHLDDFVAAWSAVDPCGTGYTHHNNIMGLLCNMEPPLGVGAVCPMREIRNQLIRMNIPVTAEGNIAFAATAFSIVRNSLCIKFPSAEEMNQADKELKRLLSEHFPRQPQIPETLMPESTTGMTTGRIYAGKMLLRNWRKKRAARKDGPADLSGVVAQVLQSNDVVLQEETDVKDNSDSD